MKGNIIILYIVFGALMFLLCHVSYACSSKNNPEKICCSINSIKNSNKTCCTNDDGTNSDCSVTHQTNCSKNCGGKCKHKGCQCSTVNYCPQAYIPNENLDVRFTLEIQYRAGIPISSDILPSSIYCAIWALPKIG